MRGGIEQDGTSGWESRKWVGLYWMDRVAWDGMGWGGDGLDAIGRGYPRGRAFHGRAV